MPRCCRREDAAVCKTTMWTTKEMEAAKTMAEMTRATTRMAMETSGMVAPEMEVETAPETEMETARETETALETVTTGIRAVQAMAGMAAGRKVVVTEGLGTSQIRLPPRSHPRRHPVRRARATPTEAIQAKLLLRHRPRLLVPRRVSPECRVTRRRPGKRQARN